MPDYFLKIAEAPGGSTDKFHPGEIVVNSYSWGVTQTGAVSGGTGGTSKAVPQDFHFVTPMSKASPALFEACATGVHLKEATLTGRTTGTTQVEFLTVKLSDVLVTSYQNGGSEQSALLPTDQVSLNYGKIQIEFKTVNSSGVVTDTTKGGYDYKNQIKV